MPVTSLLSTPCSLKYSHVHKIATSEIQPKVAWPTVFSVKAPPCFFPLFPIPYIWYRLLQIAWDAFSIKTMKLLIWFLWHKKLNGFPSKNRPNYLPYLIDIIMRWHIDWMVSSGTQIRQSPGITNARREISKTDDSFFGVFILSLKMNTLLGWISHYFMNYELCIIHYELCIEILPQDMMFLIWKVIAILVKT